MQKTTCLKLRRGKNLAGGKSRSHSDLASLYTWRFQTPLHDSQLSYVTVPPLFPPSPRHSVATSYMLRRLQVVLVVARSMYDLPTYPDALSFNTSPHLIDKILSVRNLALVGACHHRTLTDRPSALLCSLSRVPLLSPRPSPPPSATAHIRHSRSFHLRSHT